MGFFSNLFSNRSKKIEQLPEVDINKVISKIREAEEIQNVPLGKKIYSFDYRDLSIRFDRDVTRNGRISIFDGNEKLFSFTVFAKAEEYDRLKEAFESVIAFLEGDRSIQNLPDNRVLKGFYHRH